MEKLDSALCQWIVLYIQYSFVLSSFNWFYSLFYFLRAIPQKWWEKVDQTVSSILIKLIEFLKTHTKQKAYRFL